LKKEETRIANHSKKIDFVFRNLSNSKLPTDFIEMSSNQNALSCLTFKIALADSLDAYKSRTRLFSSRKFRIALLDRAREMKIESFRDIRRELENGNYKYTKLFVKGLLTYMSDISSFPYTFYPDGIAKIEYRYQNDDTFDIEMDFSGPRGDRTVVAIVRLIKKGIAAEVAVEEHIEDMICNIRKEILFGFCDEAIKDMEAHLIESDENDDYEEEEREVKVFECESCPICWEKLEYKFIPQCGHPICAECKVNIDKCPTCRASFEVKGHCYDDAKELVENEIEECCARGNNERLKTLVDWRAVASHCLQEDGFGHSIGCEYEVDWGYDGGIPGESDYYWVLCEN
jgi:hypothetical protein